MDNRRIIGLKQELVTLDGQKNELSEKSRKKKSNASTGNILMLFAIICLLIGFAIPELWVIFLLLLIISIIMYALSSGKSEIQNQLTAINKRIENVKKEIIEIENT